MTGRRRESRAGFALPTVLGVVAILTLVFLSAAAALKVLSSSARTALENAEFQRVAMSAEAEALFLASTTPFAVDGLQVGAVPTQAGEKTPRSRLRLDGRAYRWRPDLNPGLRLALQDEAGLINIDATRPDTLLRLFARLGLSSAEAGALGGRLLDLLGMRGNDRADPKAGPPAAAKPASGHLLGDLTEVESIPGWSALVSGARKRAFRQWAAADPTSHAFNLNTAPPDVLAIVLNLTAADVARIVAVREAAPVTTMAQAGLPTSDALEPPLRPNGRVRLTVSDVGRGWSYTSRLVPNADPSGPPWLATLVVLSRGEAPPAAVATFPVGAADAR